MTRKGEAGGHLPELQSLRGFAAVTVMIHHALRALVPGEWAWAVSEVPLNARAAVVLFFVLSGYVLGLSLIRRGLTAPGLIAFYVRRAFRIYPALWVATGVGVAYLWLVQPLAAPTMAPWAQSHYDPARFGMSLVLQSVTGLSGYLLPTAWTITVEIVASVLLPLIVVALLRHRAVAALLLVALLLIGVISGPALRQVPFYLGAFAIGAALVCLPAARRLRPRPAVTLAAAALLCLSQLVLPSGGFGWGAMVVETLASAVLIAGLVEHRAAWMRAGPLVALGDWSYSIYLLHLPIVYTIVRVADQAGMIGRDHDVAAVLVALATAAVTIPLAAFVYRFVERPGIAVGGMLLRRLRREPSAASQPRARAASAPPS